MTDTGFADIAAHEPKHVDISSADASVDLIAAVTSKRIRIIALVLKVSAAGAIIFQSNAATNLGRITFSANETLLVLPRNADGWLQTAVGEKFTIDNAGTLTLTGCATYIEL